MQVHSTLLLCEHASFIPQFDMNPVMHATLWLDFQVPKTDPMLEKGNYCGSVNASRGILTYGPIWAQVLGDIGVISFSECQDSY